MDIKNNLLKKSADDLADLVVMLLDNLNEKQRLDFIGKYIDAEIALEALAKDHKKDIVQQVAGFCAECLDGIYFIDAEYDDYYDAYDEAAYTDSEWAARLSGYFRLAVLYARTGNCRTAYELFKELFNCIYQCEKDNELLGVHDPLSYIDIGTDDIFDLYFFAIQAVKSDLFEAYNEILAVWQHFKCYCGYSLRPPDSSVLFSQLHAFPVSAKNGLLCKYISDLAIATDAVIRRIKATDSFPESETMFLMLETLFAQKDKPFDKLKISEQLLCCHDNFSYYVACGHSEQGQWERAIGIAADYLKKTTGKTRKQFESLLTDCYEKSGNLCKSYENSLSMFFRYKSYDLYKRTRNIAKKIDGIGVVTFFEAAQEYLSKDEDYDVKTVYTQILSFEGKVKDLVELSVGDADSFNYDRLKYSAKSLIYRALKDKAGLPPNLSEYITGIITSNPSGITDMLRYESDTVETINMLSSAIKILQKQIQFHIDAAKRSRYVTAAYYLGVVADIYGYLGESEKGNDYITLLLAQNSRRPAFKDEVRRRIDSSAKGEK